MWKCHGGRKLRKHCLEGEKTIRTARLVYSSSRSQEETVTSPRCGKELHWKLFGARKRKEKKALWMLKGISWLHREGFHLHLGRSLGACGEDMRSGKRRNGTFRPAGRGLGAGYT